MQVVLSLALEWGWVGLEFQFRPTATWDTELESTNISDIWHIWKDNDIKLQIPVWLRWQMWSAATCTQPSPGFSVKCSLWPHGCCMGLLWPLPADTGLSTWEVPHCWPWRFPGPSALGAQSALPGHPHCGIWRNDLYQGDLCKHGKAMSVILHFNQNSVL